MPFGVTPEYIATAAIDCDTTASEIEQSLTAVRQYVVSLRDEWEGVAAQNFDSVMHDFDVFGTMLHNALLNIGAGLRGNFNNYVDVEDFAAGNLVTVNNEIPGVYL
ncbi:WXG100 family type VII secretion target [Micromonospora luteifusca]|uniref:ESAT-6-like protein n=1 Tax=Micromonospora luteifusca TaxID=709860 RepID=A0ABS2LNJ7_9ACTN|nr:WXG100 family type VII secretion target [Micromonospora luteifusca]MBM7489489.1 WXG100 family type VII secretion target [Micromonospora luteifusca]